jgi:hypothetical protein
MQNTRRSSAFLEFHNGNMIKLLEMHVDGYKGCVLYSCTSAYSPDLELLHIRIASPRWFGTDLYAQERLKKTACPVYNKDLAEAACAKAHPQIDDHYRYNGEVYFKSALRSRTPRWV